MSGSSPRAEFAASSHRSALLQPPGFDRQIGAGQPEPFVIRCRSRRLSQEFQVSFQRRRIKVECDVFAQQGQPLGRGDPLIVPSFFDQPAGGVDPPLLNEDQEQQVPQIVRVLDAGLGEGRPSESARHPRTVPPASATCAWASAALARQW